MWKSSIIAALFCDLDRGTVTDESPIGKEEMRSIAGTTSFSVDRDSKALRLVRR
jgi:hypothetical protein